MKIGYPCINRSLDCKGNKTFRLKSYSEERLIETVEKNLDCLQRMLEYNIENDLYFFRITSDLIPFASHEVNEYDWCSHFKEEFKKIGDMIQKNDIRINMHPDQFIVLNSKKEDVYQNSVDELIYHAQVLDSLGLDQSAKIQLHVGGVYGEKEKSMERFAERYLELEEKIKNRLVIENDEKSYSLSDCLEIAQKTGIPVVADYLHHKINNRSKGFGDILSDVNDTWSKKDGKMMIDYSDQAPDEKEGKHAETIDKGEFKKFLEKTKSHDFDLMLEIKDKDKSALKALKIAETIDGIKLDKP